MSILSERLKALRNEAGKTQEEMAKLIGISRTTYTEYERGKNKPPIQKLQIMADYYGVPIDFLMGNSNSKPVKNIVDVSLTIEKIINHLEKDDSLTFDGKDITKESKGMLIDSLKNTLKMVKIINNK